MSVTANAFITTSKIWHKHMILYIKKEKLEANRKKEHNCLLLNWGEEAIMLIFSMPKA